MRFASATLAFTILLCARPAMADVPADLNGTWVVKSFTADGESVALFVGGEFTFAEDKITMKMAGREESGSYKVSQGAKHRQLDITGKGPGGKPNTSEAIFKVEGDTLTICTGLTTTETTRGVDGEESDPVTRKDPRPTDFDDKQGALIVLKRRPTSE